MHDINVIGMRAQTVYTLTAIATYSDGSVMRSNSVQYTTGDLPDNAPAVTLSASTGEGAGGVTFFGIGVGQGDSSGTPGFWGVDEEGEIVWYLHGDYTIGSSPALCEIESGVFLIFLRNSVRTITTAGETFAEYSLGMYHHEAILLPNGNTMNLGTESGTNDEGTLISGDEIIEKDSSGDTLWVWSSFNHLDTTRFPGALSITENNSGALDWTHANALL